MWVQPRLLLLLLVGFAAVWDAAAIDKCGVGTNRKKSICRSCAKATGCKSCATGYFLYRTYNAEVTVATGNVCCPRTCSECNPDGSCVVFDNPVLSDSPFPRFDKIKTGHIFNALSYVGSWWDFRYQEMLINMPKDYTWEQLYDALARLDDRWDRVQAIAGLLSSTMGSPQLRQQVAAQVRDMKHKRQRALQDPRHIHMLSNLKARYTAAQGSTAPDVATAAGLVGRLTPVQERILQLDHNSLYLGGGMLPLKSQERLRAINANLNTLSSSYSSNVVDSSAAWTKLVTNKTELEGLPLQLLEQGAQQAKERAGKKDATPEAGPWLLTLDGSFFMSALTFSKNRALRKELYIARNAVASAYLQNRTYNNIPNVLKILALRDELAQLFGLPSYAHYSMLDKMASVKDANALLQEVLHYSLPVAKKDQAALAAFAKTQGLQEPLQPWDVPFYDQQFKRTQYGVNEEDLSPYLSLPSVLGALSATVSRLFGAELVAADGEQPVWHPDVRFFKVLIDGKPKGYLYLDPYFRAGQKQGGAWVSTLVDQSRLFAAPGTSVRPPVAMMITNFPPPSAGKPSLLTWIDAVTIFHEMGHALQVLLTTQVEAQVAGLKGIEWDASELPSQFMEKWLSSDSSTLRKLKHYQTGAPMPFGLIKSVVKACVYRLAYQNTFQLYYGRTDLAIHQTRPPPIKAAALQQLDRSVQENTLPIQLPPTYCLLCSFTHIFDGGSAAGYYGYMWSNVMAADAFAAFQEVGLDKEARVQALGRKFRSTILGLGGSLPAAEVYMRFRGKAPTIDALLRNQGLKP